ncbi:hypothetical protein [Bacillus weihaiensis]|uniref:Uncharacterized protein n=1 Tax=Bacillus weihaiensis TaxID=1547283 RepID=A0A1L3MUA0_9BACI|nr:hypothetical protein [Bacillus weihaiensis]APH05860.1 hypothetical protein A9C19_14570 [Bacillus weihaiensis]
MPNYKFIEKISEVYSDNWVGTSKYYIWDEVEYAKLIIKIGKTISNHMFKDVFLMAKYYYHVEKINNDKLIKEKLEELIRIKKFPINNQLIFKGLIDGAISGSKKQHMKVCRAIRITQNEIDQINSLSDNTTRKIAFTMLCMWKANGNKPYRASMHQIANEIGINANGKKLKDIYFTLLFKEKIIYRYNNRVERRKRLLEKLVEVDSQYGELFIPYDAIKYESHLLRPTRKSAIAIWRYEQDYYETPYLKTSDYYKEMTPEQKEAFKVSRHKVNEEDMLGDDELDKFYSSINLDYIKKNIDYIAWIYSRNDFARLIGGDVFYEENQAHEKIKVLFADSELTDGIVIDVNNLSGEYDKLFGRNKVLFGNCTDCGIKIVKNSNRTKYCSDCRIKVRNEKVKENMRKMRNKTV